MFLKAHREEVGRNSCWNWSDSWDLPVRLCRHTFKVLCGSPGSHDQTPQPIRELGSDFSSREERERIKREEQKRRPALICTPALDVLPVLTARRYDLLCV